MKRFTCVILCVVLMIAGVLVVKNKQEENNQILRFHIRANSNSSFDQYAKYVVKDKIISLLAPCFDNLETNEQAEEFIYSSMNIIQEYANSILKSLHCDYGCKVSFSNEYFEEKELDNVLYSAGIYKSLIISLGESSGNNWWCLVYPSLSYVPIKSSSVDYTNIIYKSKIVEICSKIA